MFNSKYGYYFALRAELIAREEATVVDAAVHRNSTVSQRGDAIKKLPLEQYVKQSAAIKEILRNIAPYDGSSPVDDFLRAVLSKCRRKCFAEQIVVQLVINTRLTGRARDVFKYVMPNNLKHFAELLRQRFEKGRSYATLNQLRASMLDQFEAESVQEYIERWSELHYEIRELVFSNNAPFAAETGEEIIDNLEREEIVSGINFELGLLPFIRKRIQLQTEELPTFTTLAVRAQDAEDECCLVDAVARREAASFEPRSSQGRSTQTREQYENSIALHNLAVLSHIVKQEDAREATVREAVVREVAERKAVARVDADREVFAREAAERKAVARAAALRLAVAREDALRKTIARESSFEATSSGESTFCRKSGAMSRSAKRRRTAARRAERKEQRNVEFMVLSNESFFEETTLKAQEWLKMKEKDDAARRKYDTKKYMAELAALDHQRDEEYLRRADEEPQCEDPHLQDDSQPDHAKKVEDFEQKEVLIHEKSELVILQQTAEVPLSQLCDEPVCATAPNPQPVSPLVDERVVKIPLPRRKTNLRAEGFPPQPLPRVVSLQVKDCVPPQPRPRDDKPQADGPSPLLHHLNGSVSQLHNTDDPVQPQVNSHSLTATQPQLNNESPPGADAALFDTRSQLLLGTLIDTSGQRLEKGLLESTALKIACKKTPPLSQNRIGMRKLQRKSLASRSIRPLRRNMSKRKIMQQRKRPNPRTGPRVRKKNVERSKQSPHTKNSHRKRLSLALRKGHTERKMVRMKNKTQNTLARNFDDGYVSEISIDDDNPAKKLGTRLAQRNASSRHLQKHPRRPPRGRIKNVGKFQVRSENLC
jgi:hypothetical protein